MAQAQQHHAGGLDGKQVKTQQAKRLGGGHRQAVFIQPLPVAGDAQALAGQAHCPVGHFQRIVKPVLIKIIAIQTHQHRQIVGCQQKCPQQRQFGFRLTVAFGGAVHQLLHFGRQRRFEVQRAIGKIKQVHGVFSLGRRGLDGITAQLAGRTGATVRVAVGGIQGLAAQLGQFEFKLVDALHQAADRPCYRVW